MNPADPKNLLPPGVARRTNLTDQPASCEFGGLGVLGVDVQIGPLANGNKGQSMIRFKSGCGELHVEAVTNIGGEPDELDAYSLTIHTYGDDEAGQWCGLLRFAADAAAAQFLDERARGNTAGGYTIYNPYSDRPICGSGVFDALGDLHERAERAKRVVGLLFKLAGDSLVAKSLVQQFHEDLVKAGILF
jgi:hypothetical protein